MSYALGLTGPSLVADTACSSSGVALILARQGLLMGDCPMAVVATAASNVCVCVSCMMCDVLFC